jgi:hypothetical protein
MTQTAAQDFFELWKKQMEEGAKVWTQMVGQTQAAATPQPDPLAMWRPFMEQATQAWLNTMKAGAAGPAGADMFAQGKAFLEQWISAWDKLLANTMQTEAFAQAMGKHLDQWLSAHGPARKAAAEQMETTLQAMGIPSRNQVIAVSRQLMDLDDRLEDIEDTLAALRAQLDRVSSERAEPRRKAPDRPTAPETK